MSKPSPHSPASVEIEITALGAAGDGIGAYEHEPLYVAGALPGERVAVRAGARQGGVRRGHLVRVLHAAPNRVAPRCPHFGVCGGCALQHLDDDGLRAWTMARVAEALHRCGAPADTPVAYAIVPPASRRRARFVVARPGVGARPGARPGACPGGGRGGAQGGGRGGDPRLGLAGFQERQSHRVVDVRTCPLLVPELAALPALLRALAVDVLAPEERMDVVASALEGGLDILLVGPPRLGLAARERLAEFAAAGGIARLSWQAGDSAASEPVVAAAVPLVRFGGVAIAVPPGAFLQPSLAGEAALTGAVLAACADVARAGGRIADLYAGLGTFSLPLVAAGARVHAIDTDAPALTALGAAARQHHLIPASVMFDPMPAALPASRRPSGDTVPRHPQPKAERPLETGYKGSGSDIKRVGMTHRLTTEARNLATAPLPQAALKHFDAVVLDPPRAGAGPQIAALAGAAVPVVVCVSCNPATWTRDARTLLAAGYRLRALTVVDQFLWSGHLEMVGVFAAGGGQTGR